MVEGIILAGGFSSRANTNKLLLPYEGESLIVHAIKGMLKHVDHIFVVTGHYHLEIKDQINGFNNVTIIFNPNYSSGMFSSVLAGIHYVNGDAFILPCDCPLVSDTTYELLLKGQKSIRVPTYLGKDGHPIFIAKDMVDVLKNEPIGSNLKAFRNSQGYEKIETNDRFILTDIDTIEDYQKLLKERK